MEELEVRPLQLTLHRSDGYVSEMLDGLNVTYVDLMAFQLPLIEQHPFQNGVCE